MTQTTTPKPPIDSRFIMPFMVATRDVFQKMAGVATTIGKPHLKGDSNQSTCEVCGIIGFSGQITGSVVISFSNQAALNLVEAFAGVKFAITDPDFADAIGELANMIAGSAKKDLGALASISIPSVVIGKGCTVALTRSAPCLVIPCSSPLGNFAVEVSIKRNPGE
jgi:chemotaxis protein CheX